MTARPIPCFRSLGGIVPGAASVIFAAVQMATAFRVLADRVRTAIARGMRWPLWN